MASVEVQTIKPIETMVPMPVSTSKHILKKRQVEILPTEVNSFTYGGTDRIIFNISSATELMNGMESYVKFTLEVANTTNGSFDFGGVNGLFRSIELRTQNGTLIQRYDRYNRWNAMRSILMDDPTYVDTYGHTYGDGVSSALVQVNNTTYTFKPNISFFQQPYFIPLMLIKQGLQLILELEQPAIAFKVGANADAANALNPTYTIKEPRFVAMMVTPDEDIVRQYMTAYQGSGLNMIMEGVRHKRTTIPADMGGISSLNLYFGVRSARKVFTVLQPSLVSDTPADRKTKGNFSLSTYYRGGLTKYQYKVGSEEFPHREVYLYNGSEADLLQQVSLCTNNSAYKAPSRITFNSLLDANGDVIQIDGPATTATATKIVLCTRLDRDNESPFTGTDLSINPLDLEMDITAPSEAIQGLGDKVVNVFLHYDMMVSISSAGLIVRT